MGAKIHYRDFVTGKSHWTRGAFVKWQWDKLIRSFRAIIQRERSILYIPDYLIYPRSLKYLPERPRYCDHCYEQESDEGEIYACEECGMNICWMCSQEHSNGRCCDLCWVGQEETTHPALWTY
jgi:hypothetical protein